MAPSSKPDELVQAKPQPVQPVPTVIPQTPNKTPNSFEEMLSLGNENGLQKEMARIKEFMPKVKASHGTDAVTYLGLNSAASAQIEFSDNVPEWSYGY